MPHPNNTITDLSIALETWAGLEKSGAVGDAIGVLLVTLTDHPSPNVNSITHELTEPGPYVELVMNLGETAGLMEVQRPMLAHPERNWESVGETLC